jgi:hypothetical protein
VDLWLARLLFYCCHANSLLVGFAKEDNCRFNTSSWYTIIQRRAQHGIYDKGCLSFITMATKFRDSSCLTQSLAALQDLLHPKEVNPRQNQHMCRHEENKNKIFLADSLHSSSMLQWHPCSLAGAATSCRGASPPCNPKCTSNRPISRKSKNSGIQMRSVSMESAIHR